MEKYKLLIDDKIVHKRKALYRIQALKNFAGVYKGQKGGYIESEKNLSQKGDCWIYDNAKVYGDAYVFGNASISGSAEIYGNARVYDSSKINANAKVYEDAEISGNAEIFGFAQVYGNANISDRAIVYGNAKVYEDAIVFDYAKVFHNAKVCGTAQVGGEARVFNNARISEEMNVKFGHCDKNLSHKINLPDNIRCQTNLPVFSDEKGKYVIGFKHVRKFKNKFVSGYNSKFVYKLNEWAEVENPDLSKKSCASGLHFSNLTYWEGNNLDTVIQVKCYLKDIITVQNGKIRCKKLLPMAIVENGHI